MSKKTILLVEDDLGVRQLCEMILRSHKFEPLVTVNGEHGLTTYRERHEEICLVISDVKMPVMGGIEMTRRIFELHSHANIILMSGTGVEDVVPDHLRRLCSVVEKPFTPKVLIDAVKKCLKYDQEHYGTASP